MIMLVYFSDPTMKHLQNQIVFFAIVLLFKLVRSTPEWAESENGEKYLIESKYEYTWFEALHECSKRNMSLVALDTPEKNYDMIKLLKNRFGMGLNLWIGATASTAENSNRKFVWVSSGKTFNFAHWQEGEPNNLAGDQSCVHTWSISNDFRWADGQWHLKFGYICEETLSSLCRKELESKRQEIKDINNKLLSFFSESQKRTEQISQAQQLLTEQIGLEIEEKLKKTKELIDHTLEN